MVGLVLIYPVGQIDNNRVPHLTIQQTGQAPQLGIVEPVPGKYYSLILDDPDAPGVLSGYLHWIVMDLNPYNDSEPGQEVLSYTGPNPPDRPHQYRATLYQHDHQIRISLFDDIKRVGYPMSQLLPLLSLSPKYQVDQIGFIVGPSEPNYTANSSINIVGQ